MRKPIYFFILALLLLGGYQAYTPGILRAAGSEDVRFETSPLKLVNINLAGAEELQSLKGVGPAIAEKIIRYREENGRFEKAEDLTKVRGIGAAKFEKIRELISI